MRPRLRKIRVIRPARLVPSRGSWVCVDEDGPCWAPLSNAAGRRQASLGTPIPRTPTVSLLIEDPFIFYGLPIIGKFNQSPHFVLIHGFHLRFHGLKPFRGIWAHHRFLLVCRFVMVK